jgi:hypothetical protein
MSAFGDTHRKINGTGRYSLSDGGRCGGIHKFLILFVNVRPEELQGSAGLGRRKPVRKDS